ncbi:MAG TPA: hypothetical protein PKL73_05090 [Polyangiaceae bacterium]|jgi:hypothetical protein|nr:MAG: hypothetical protein BWY17_02202 [Deltaproteobacteria bacterium ADurb.Bin207]HNS96307.1 hypothetical protein [Polyangiaceae bacterium]HNZ22039.1 hypothetical protein [Polyangiaceae bacterium]HOD22205.1 hypothetical protein [Polyangiaceae bacterium]HOE47347.1 hypothetical protein [Polyangiaceae bacterium]
MYARSPHAHPWLAILSLSVLLSCGGQAIVPGDDTDPKNPSKDAGSEQDGAVGGSGGTSGTGGVGGEAATDGTGVGGSSPECPPLPYCNWCHGDTVYDEKGCAIGYVCANGADPCNTPPCSSTESCPPNQHCGADDLCWDADCGKMICGESIGGSVQTCECSWSCSDGNSYQFFCEASASGISCNCFINGSNVAGCGTGGSGGGLPDDLCSVGESCCAFPQ